MFKGLGFWLGVQKLQEKATKDEGILVIATQA